MIRQGILEISRRKKLVLLWYALNLIFGMIIVAPMTVAIGSFLGVSLEVKRLFDNFDPSWVAEFGYNAHWTQSIIWLPIIILIGASFVLLTTGLSGGLLAVLHNPGESFGAGCTRWFPPFLRLALFSGILYAIAFAARAATSSLFQKLGDDSMSGKPSAYGAAANFLVTWVAFSFVNMLVDYAKIHMVVHGERKARRGLVQGVRFVFRNLRRCLAVFAALTALMLLMLAVYHISSEVIGQASIGAVLLLFLVRQIYMLGRTWLRLVFFASEHALFASRLPKPAPPPVLEESLEFNESF